MIEKITQQQIDDNSVGKLSTRPNAPPAMGGNGLSAPALRARFDALALLAIEKINDILSYLYGDVLPDGTTASFPSLIKFTGIDGVEYTLKDILESLQNGDFFPVDQSFDPESTSPQSGTAVTEAINRIGLFAMYTLEPQSPISDIVEGYTNSFGIEYFNRTPIVGDNFYCFGISNDGVSFHMAAQVTDFVDGGNGKINAAFVALEVVTEKAEQVFDGTSIHAQSGKAVAEEIEKSKSETKKYVDDKLEDFDLGDKVTVDPTYSPTSANAQSGTAVAQALGKLSLGLHTDGLLYVFIDGEPVGEGIALQGGAIGDVIGTLDENNNIILTGELADGTYTLKYENADGTYTEIGSLVVAEAPEAEEIINQIPISTDSSGAVYNGTGYKQNVRLKSDNVTEDTVSANTDLTGYIPAVAGDILCFKNIVFDPTDGAYLSIIRLYDSAFTPLWAKSYGNDGFIPTVENGVYQYTIPNEYPTTAYFRLQAQTIDETSIITVNQEIV